VGSTASRYENTGRRSPRTALERFIDNRPDRAKSMVRRHPSLATHVREQSLV
jgi:hypothetical protein